MTSGRGNAEHLAAWSLLEVQQTREQEETTSQELRASDVFMPDGCPVPDLVD